MKLISRLLLLQAFLFLAACGTLQVEYVPAPTFIVPTPTSMTFVISPQECSQFLNDTALPSDPGDPGSYIGLHYDEMKLPEGLGLNQVYPLSDNGEYRRAWVSRPDIDLEFILQTNCRRVDGSLYNTIVDAIQIPRESGAYARAGYCLPDPDPGPVIVFGRYDKNQPQVTLGDAQGWSMTNLDYGQHIDLQTMRYAPYPLEGLQCLRLVPPGG